MVFGKELPNSAVMCLGCGATLMNIAQWELHLWHRPTVHPPPPDGDFYAARRCEIEEMVRVMENASQEYLQENQSRHGNMKAMAEAIYDRWCEH